MEFNMQQKEAIAHNKGAMLVLAGPGSGKTTVIIHRVKYLIEIHHVSPKKILVITYTKAAATEMQERFLQLGVAGGEGVMFATFHSIFFRILRRAYGYQLQQLIQEEEKWSLFKKWVTEAEIETNDQEEYIKDLLSELSLMKNELIPLKQYQPVNFSQELFRYFVKKYEQYKAVQNKIDFDDMLTQCYDYLTTEEAGRAYWQSRFEYILLDEFQDINQAQNACTKLLAQPQNNIFAVGDDDQSIYCFRGARPEFLLQFPKKYENAKKIVLPVNYRSTERIIKLSEKIISHNQNRFEKHMHGQGQEGRKIVFFTERNAFEEAEKISQKLASLRQKGIAYEQMAVIYRTNLQGGVFTRALTEKGIPFVLKDKSMNVYRHWITKDLTAYLLLAEQPENDSAFRRIVNKPKRYISKELLKKGENLPYPFYRGLFLLPELKKYQSQALEELKMHLLQIKRKKPAEALKYIRKTVGYDAYLMEYARFRKASLQGYLELAEEITQFANAAEDTEAFLQKLSEMDQQMQSHNLQPQNKMQGVTLSTMHSAKGLEFEVVFIPSIIQGVIPHEKNSTQQGLEEERRLFYVAVTRAKSRLYLSEITKRYDKDAQRSCFLKELGLK